MRRTRIVTASLLVVLLVAGIAVLTRQTVFAPKTVFAYFTNATAIYPGDEVRVSGVKVGTITNIEPQGAEAKMTLHVDRDLAKLLVIDIKGNCNHVRIISFLRANVCDKQ